MKVRRVKIRNFRSVQDAAFDLYDYTMLVGANNSGKSTVVNALRVFYDDLAWTSGDMPKIPGADEEAWIEVEYVLTADEYASLPAKYQAGPQVLKVRKILNSEKEPNRVKAKQSNIYAHLPDGTLEDTLFFGAKNISQAKLGSVIYVPALSTPGETFKVSGPSPFRSVISFLLKRVVESSKGYAELGKAFALLNEEAKGKTGFLTQLCDPMNTALEKWGVSMVMDVKPVSPEDIVKNQIEHAFRDSTFDANLPIDRFGHGFQRSVIYELIKLAPRFQDGKKSEKKEFDPDFTLVLFEEPEAFLHPNQQETMSHSLRRLGADGEQQVLVTTHSPIFVGKAANDLKQIVRLVREGGVSKVFQPAETGLEEILTGAKKLRDTLDAFVNDGTIDETKKKKARKLVAAFPAEEVAVQEDKFRFQLWLDGERAAAFFAGRVLICEGASEKALLNYLLENDWSDLREAGLFVLEALGKYNFPRYLLLLEAFGIPHGVLLDGDADQNEHQAINDLIHSLQGSHTIGIHKFDLDLEDFLGTTKPGNDRDDRKPIEIIKAMAAGDIDAAKLAALKGILAGICDIPLPKAGAPTEAIPAPKAEGMLADVVA
ncbi:putative ATP-dependent endonuclease of the OLD family protein [Magnetospirillum sp. XM-1]|uniref:ATP-dependent nuclease n=1 Tax=Magnetospirillum sp. XM-1 TaxID=1663591 RepID=UPI00073DF3E1|nr:AAA family ATPase [Magnetospirillum sp. XM-1]CUW40842.1 putative ATP-dependent endonuclease of the OLD family protein [Magnetospirillum sp. XM-1]